MEREPKQKPPERRAEPSREPSKLRHDLRSEEGEETELGDAIRAREPEEGSEPDVLGLEETRPA